MPGAKEKRRRTAKSNSILDGCISIYSIHFHSYVHFLQRFSTFLDFLGFDKKNTRFLRLKPVRSWFGASASILARTCHVTPCAPEVSVKIILRQATSVMSARLGWEFLRLVKTTKYRDFEDPSSWGNQKVRSCRNQYPGENMSWCQGRNHPKSYFV